MRLVEVYTQYHSTTELHGMEALKVESNRSITYHMLLLLMYLLQEFLDLHNLWELIPSTIEMSLSQ